MSCFVEARSHLRFSHLQPTRTGRKPRSCLLGPSFPACVPCPGAHQGIIFPAEELRAGSHLAEVPEKLLVWFLYLQSSELSIPQTTSERVKELLMDPLPTQVPLTRKS